MREVLAYSDRLVEELFASDVLVLGVPMYNFGVPAMLKAYIDQDEDPEERRKAMERDREEAVAAARAALANHPAEARGGFEALLTAAQSTSFLQEDHNYWIDQRGLHEVRQVCMELGRRLVANGPEFRDGSRALCHLQ